MEFVFESSPWEQFAQEVQPDQKISAWYLLTLLEGEDDTTAEQLFGLLEQRRAKIDLSDLPRPSITGENGLRLRAEAEFANQEKYWTQLDENDPLRLYMEELDKSADAFAPELRRVAQLAKGYTGWGVLLLDLIQEGSLGLLQADDLSDGEKDEKIAFYMEKAVIQQARASGVGQKLRSALEDYRSVDEKLLGELGRNPTLEEIAEELHMDAEAAALLADMLDNVRRMDRVKAPQKPEEDEEEDQAVENTAYFQMRQRIEDLLSVLPAEEAKLLSLRFGLEGGVPMTPEQVGRQLGLTPGEVTQIEAAALSKLRNEK